MDKDIYYGRKVKSRGRIRHIGPLKSDFAGGQSCQTDISWCVAIGMQTQAVPEGVSLRYEPDCALVKRARARDGVAFEELITRHETKLSRLTARFFSAENDRQDVLQVALLLAWRNLPTFEGRADFGSWIYRVTINAALVHLRSQRRHPELAVDDVETLTTNDTGDTGGFRLDGFAGRSDRPDERMESQELRKQLQTAVDALPEGLRTVFCLRHVDGFSTRATAQALGISSGAVRARLHRARGILRQEMLDCALDGPG